MKVLASGTLTGVTGAAWASGVSTPPIDLSISREYSQAGIWLSVEGDLGRTGGSIAVIWKASYSKGVTYTCPVVLSAITDVGQFLIKSGTSKTGFFGDGGYTRNLVIPFPFIRLQAVASKAGVTNHGTGTTNSCIIRWAVCQP